MKVLVVDDEAPARRRLLRLLRRIDGVEVVGEASDGIEARELIASAKPELVLLDIDMPGLDGLSVAAELDSPAVVFTTAHTEHAVEAFDLDAADYLLKPVTSERLATAIDRARSRLGGHAPVTGNAEPRVTARSGSTVHVFDARKVTRFQAADKYTVFHSDGEQYVLDESLSALEVRLAGHGFVRVHRAELIRLADVKALHLEDDGPVVELGDGVRVSVSRRHLPALKRRLGIR